MCKSKSVGGIIAKTLLSLLIIILAFVLIIGLIVPTINYFIKEDVKVYDGLTNPHISKERTFISAHRAGGDLAPEETLSAFELCMTDTSYSVDVVEFDLHITKDGNLILLHDDTVNRTSDATERFGKDEVYAKDLTLAELKTLNFGENFVDPDGNTPYKGKRGEDIPDNVKVLSLKEILDYLTATKSDLNYVIEIKDDGDLGKKAMDMLYKTLVEYNILNQTIVGTFHNTITKYIDEAYPDVIRSASIMEVLGMYLGFLFNVQTKLTYSYSFEVLQIPVGMFVWDFGDAGFINYAHKRNIAVQYWTINDTEEADRLRKNGADCIITDNPKAIYNKFNAKA